MSTQRHEQTYWDIVRAQYKRNRTAVAGLWVVSLLFLLAIFAPVLATSSPFLLDKNETAFLKAYDANGDGRVEPKECDDPALFDEVESAADGQRDNVASAEDIEAWGRLQFPWFRDLFDQNVWQGAVDIFFNIALVLLLPLLLALKFLPWSSRRILGCFGTLLVLLFFLMAGPDSIAKLRYSSAKRDYVGSTLSARHELLLTEQRVPQFEERLEQMQEALKLTQADAKRSDLTEQERSDAEAIVISAQADADEMARKLGEWKQRYEHAEKRAANPVHQYTAIVPPIGFHHNDKDLERVTERPSWSGWGTGHFLGTDTLGRDVLSRILYGTRVSLTIGVIAVALYCTIGTILGAIMGFFGGRVDMLLMRLVEIMICFPRLPFLLIIVGVFRSRSIYLIMIAIGIVSWAGVARLVRGQFLSERNLDYVTAARGLGIPTHRIVFKHVLPNAIHPMFVAATFGVAAAILIESGLAFLGLGDPNVPSWGQILLKGRETMSMWLIVSPGIAIFLTVTALNLVGEGLRDALDPKLRQ